MTQEAARALWEAQRGSVTRFVMTRSEQTGLLEMGRRLVALREAVGLNQAEWGRRLGFEPQKVNNWERGYNRIGIDSAIQICRHTGVTLDYIFLGSMSALPWELAGKIDRALTESEAAPPPAARRRRRPGSPSRADGHTPRRG